MHEWGKANQVTFDNTKESFGIMSRTEPEGPDIKLLGIRFDMQLNMEAAVSQLHNAAMWKLRTLLKTKRYYNQREVINLYKSKVLGFIEYRTSAIYHVSLTVLQQIDSVQNKLLSNTGISREEALLEFKLAPLSSRRDIAMLAIIHRNVIGMGPGQFDKYFVANDSSRGSKRLNERRHNKQLISLRTGNYLEMFKKSLCGAIDIYNLLPQYVVEASTVSIFQHRLQELLKTQIACTTSDWEVLYSPRNTIWNNHLKRLYDYEGK